MGPEAISRGIAPETLEGGNSMNTNPDSWRNAHQTTGIGIGTHAIPEIGGGTETTPGIEKIDQDHYMVLRTWNTILIDR